jgi:tetratricopeptide (TPR) repeat protein
MELSELRRLRDAQDEMGMIAALERISEILVRLGEKEKALHALGASIAFREKHGITASSEKPYLRSGELKEQFGDLSGALEDYARTYYRANELKQEAPRVRAHELFRNLAVKMKLAADESIEQFVRLCRARALSDSTAETEALLRLANLYEKAGRPRDAGAYYERSSAAMLTDRARIQEQLGNGETARKFYDEAMETLRKLDYGRYLEFKHKGRGTQ